MHWTGCNYTEENGVETILTQKLLANFTIKEEMASNIGLTLLCVQNTDFPYNMTKMDIVMSRKPLF